MNAELILTWFPRWILNHEMEIQPLELLPRGKCGASVEAEMGGWSSLSPWEIKFPSSVLPKQQINFILSRSLAFILPLQGFTPKSDGPRLVSENDHFRLPSSVKDGWEQERSNTRTPVQVPTAELGQEICKAQEWHQKGTLDWGVGRVREDLRKKMT